MIPAQAFNDPDPFQELTFPDVITAKYAIAEQLCLPLAKLPPSQLDEINALLERTLDKSEVTAYVRDQIQPTLTR